MSLFSANFKRNASHMSHMSRMSRLTFALCALCSVLCFAVFGEVTTNEVLFVDQEGNVNRPETLATTADMATNATAILSAEQKAAAAEAAAREGTNLVQDIIRDITANELVVYRFGYTDAFGALVVIDPDAQLVITEFKPLDEVDSDGRHAFRLTYALKNSQSVAVKPEVKWSSSVSGGRDAFATLPPDQVGEPVAGGSYADKDGIEYGYTYTIKFYAPTDKSGFFIVNLTADDAAGDGMAFDLPNGVTGGFTGEVAFGSKTLSFKGGVLMGVK